MTVSINSKSVMPGSFERIRHNHGGLHPQLVRTGVVLPQHPFEFNKEGNQENSSIVLLFLGRKPLVGRSRNGVGVRVGVDIFRPESGLPKLRRLCSPGNYVCRMLMTLIFTWVILYFIGFLMLAYLHSSDFNHPSY